MHTVEKDWVTASGLRAVVLKLEIGHRCGYVGVPKTHPFSGKSYHARLYWVDDVESIEDNIRVHGGVTFSGWNPTYPVASNLWWIGFDCAHCDDNPTNCNLQFCVDECEAMAKQIANFA